MSSPVLLLEAQRALAVRAAAADIQVTMTVDADIDSPGRSSVRAGTFVELIGLLDDRELLLDDASGQLRVQGFQVDTSLQVLDGSIVPPEFPVDPGHKASISAVELVKVCSRVEIAIADNDTVPILTGALAQLADQQLSLVATDGRRLAIDRVRLSDTKGAPVRVVLPGKLVEELRRILGSEEGDVRLTVDPQGQRVLLDTPNASLRALGLDGSYPEYRRLIPASAVTGCVVPTQLLLRRLQVAAMFAPDEVPSVQLELQPGSGLAVSASSSDRGASVAEVPADITGLASYLTLDPRFLLDGLRVLSSDRVELEVAEDPPLLLVRSSPDDGFLYLVMPRTKDR